VDFELDGGAFELRHRGEPVRLEQNPFELLIVLVENPRLSTVLHFFPHIHRPSPHGSSDQRMEWFQRGVKSGNMRDCDTFR
jgi:hypothetical protein